MEIIRHFKIRAEHDKHDTLLMVGVYCFLNFAVRFLFIVTFDDISGVSSSSPLPFTVYLEAYPFEVPIWEHFHASLRNEDYSNSK